MSDPKNESGARRQRKNSGAGSPNSGSRGLLRDEVVELDRELLRLLLRRHNLLEKMRHKGRLDPAEEKILREAWQKNVARISRDADLSGRFFSLLQEMSFLPRPAPEKEGEWQPGASRREAFNLAPPRQPARIELEAPLSSEITRAWLYLAAASGQPLRVADSSGSDPVVDFVKALDQAGAALTRDGAGITARECSALGCPDRVIHAGDSAFNFYILLAHYLGRPSRVKFTGETSLKLADFSHFRHFLPRLGARLVHIVPTSDGLPVRVECSGILPPAIDIEPDLPQGFVEALILAAPFYENPLVINLGAHPRRKSILARMLPILEGARVNCAKEDRALRFESSHIELPHTPAIPLEPEIAVFLLALAEGCGGMAKLSGIWPNWPETRAFMALPAVAALGWQVTANGIGVELPKPLTKFDAGEQDPALASELPHWATPFLVCLATCAILRGGDGHLPENLRQLPETIDFWRACGLETDTTGKPLPADADSTPPVWNAPTTAWAMAVAAAACARPGKAGFHLGNPGILTTIWPYFWACYNGLPTPSLTRRAEAEENPPVKNRRRILTNSVAIPPEIREEDWEMRPLGAKTPETRSGDCGLKPQVGR